MRLVLLALGLNFVLAPAFASLLTVVIPLDRGYAIGLLLLGGAAGAPFLPQVVKAARGDLALAAALMGLLTLGDPLPALRTPVDDPRPASQSVDHRAPARAAHRPAARRRDVGEKLSRHVRGRGAPVLAKIGNASLLLFFVLLIALNVRLLLGALGSGAILVALLYFAGLFIIGWLLGGSKPEVRGVLGLATAGRNSAPRSSPPRAASTIRKSPS